MLTIDVITLFPEVFAPFVGLSIVGRAIEARLVNVRYHHLADECEGNQRVDDEPYGGGAGMVLRLAPIARVLDRLLQTESRRRSIVMPTPAGKQFRQADARKFASLEHLVIICGRYEGIDERLSALFPIEQYSLGDFVLTGGEIPALAIMDATVRLVETAIKPDSRDAESFSSELLDYPCYTRPPVFRGVSVPEVLLSGDHAAIARWRREESRRRTAERKSRD